MAEKHSNDAILLYRFVHAVVVVVVVPDRFALRYSVPAAIVMHQHVAAHFAPSVE